MECTVYAKPNFRRRSINKREWWKNWEDDEMPPLQHIIQSYDTAFMKKKLPTILLLPGACFKKMKTHHQV